MPVVIIARVCQSLMKKKKKSPNSSRLEAGVVSDLVGAINEGRLQFETHVSDLQAENARLRRVLETLVDWARAGESESYRHNDYEWGLRIGRSSARDEVRQILARLFVSDSGPKISRE